MEYFDKMSDLEDKLYTVKYTPDTNSHLQPVQECCRVCKSKICTTVCPAGVYEWDENMQKLIVNYENCLECGACRIACESASLGWEYPKGTKGVTFKQG
jgi:ferredoxin like protein